MSENSAKKRYNYFNIKKHKNKIRNDSDNGILSSSASYYQRFTRNASRNIPNIGKSVPDTMCGLGDIRNNFQHIPDTK